MTAFILVPQAKSSWNMELFLADKGEGAWGLAMLWIRMM